MKTVVSALLFLSLRAAPLAAQQAATQTAASQDSVWGAALARLRAGTSIRLHGPERGRIEGRFVGASGTTLTLDAGGTATELSTFALDSLWVRGTAARTGVSIGVIGGVIAGITLGAIANEICQGDSSSGCSEAIPILGLAGGAAGALVGALVGSAFPKWHRRIP